MSNAITFPTYARQAISTRYYGPTNTKGARIKASCDAGTLWCDWLHEMSPFNNHAAAAEDLVQKLGWRGNWVAGSTRDGYVFVYAGPVE